MKRLIASWFGSGFVLRRVIGTDNGSGTLASAVTLLPIWLLGRVGWWAQAIGAVVVTAASVWATDAHADGRSDVGAPDAGHTKEGDPGWVVSDEAAGAMVATIGLGPAGVAVAWIVFRLADILKAWFPGVKQAESLGGGVGITFDDVIAGLYGLGAGWLVQSLL